MTPTPDPPPAAPLTEGEIAAEREECFPLLHIALVSALNYWAVRHPAIYGEIYGDKEASDQWWASPMGQKYEECCGILYRTAALMGDDDARVTMEVPLDARGKEIAALRDRLARAADWEMRQYDLRQLAETARLYVRDPCPSNLADLAGEVTRYEEALLATPTDDAARDGER